MTRTRQTAVPVAGAVLLLAGLLVSVFCRVYLVQVVATAAWLGGLVLLIGALRPLLETSAPLPWKGRKWTWMQLLGEGSGPLVLLLLLCLLYSPLLKGLMPWQHDHTVHQFKAWVLAERLLPSGRIMGWTHQSGVGYPAEVL